MKTIILTLVMIIAAAQSAGAAIYTVTNTLDSGAGSLRQAVLDANGTAAADTIVFNIPAATDAGCVPATSVCTITLTNEIIITNNGSLAINGTGANRLTIDGGAGTNRVFTTNGTVTIRGATITGGNGAGATFPGFGGAVLALNGTLTLDRVYFVNNSSSSWGGAVFLYFGGTQIITNSSFSGNTSGVGAAIVVQGGALNVSNLTISGNTSSSRAGGLEIVTNGSANFRNVTMTGNHSGGQGGGVHINGGTFNFTNSIIAGNTAGGNNKPEIFLESGTAASNGFNLIGDAAGDAANTGTAFSFLATDILDTPPLLDSLANYGGTVPTMRLQANSPAIDKGSLIAGITMDARSVMRPFDDISIINAAGGNGADIGAFELIPTFARGWGRNLEGQVGDGATNSQRLSPVDLVGGFTDIVSFEGGYNHGLGLRSDGTVVSWGGNNFGQLGRAAPIVSTLAATPTQIPGLSNVAAIAGGESHSLAVLADGTVRAWGSDGNGQLGDGSATTAGGITPVTVATNAAGTIPLTGIIAVAGGSGHSIALKSDGTVWTWGDDTFGQLGDGAGNSSRAFAQQVPGLLNVIAVDAGANHNLAILADGSVRAWGSGGQIGDNSTTNRFAPVTPANLGAGANITQIAAGYQHSVALKTDGTILTWGYDHYGQLGDGTVLGGTPLVPTLINTINNVTDIKSSVGFTTYARKRDDSIFAWGYNEDGQIGDGTINTTGCFCQPTPTQSSVGAWIAVFGATGVSGFAAMPLASVSTGANQSVRLGDATVNFDNVATAGNIQIHTFDPLTTGLSVPAGYTILTNSIGYNITSSAQFSGTATVCLKVPNVIDQSQFNFLNILHDDDGDGTLDAKQLSSSDYRKREICRTTLSFSPFVIAQGLLPTAASVSIGGRVMTAKGRGIPNVFLTLTDSGGNIRSAVSSSFGYYRFADVPAGETYIISARAKRYTFIQPSQALSLLEDTEDINFIADPD